jgi:hypothetical protein
VIVIRFRRLNNHRWEIAFSEAHLHEKLNGEMAEIIMPEKPFWVRWWYRVFPSVATNERGKKPG